MSKEEHNYSNQYYWEDRYLKGGGNGSQSSTYEWYLDFAQTRDYIEQEFKTMKLSIPYLAVLVPGCGNSTLCEDLAALGKCITQEFRVGSSHHSLLRFGCPNSGGRL